MLTREQANRITQEYADLLERIGKDKIAVPASLLPYSKDTIKAALLLDFQNGPELAGADGIYQNAYACLATFVDDDKLSIANQFHEVHRKTNERLQELRERIATEGPEQAKMPMPSSEVKAYKYQDEQDERARELVHAIAMERLALMEEFIELCKQPVLQAEQGRALTKKPKPWWRFW
jgi:hypothetical protein